MSSMTPDYTWLFVKMIVGLLIVLGLAFLFIRYILPRTQLGRRRGGGWVTVVDRVPVDPHTRIFLVKVLGRYLVLGGTEGSVGLITEISREEGEKIENP